MKDTEAGLEFKCEGGRKKSMQIFVLFTMSHYLFSNSNVVSYVCLWKIELEIFDTTTR